MTCETCGLDHTGPCQDAIRAHYEGRIAFLQHVIKAQAQLLLCYRLGGLPPEWALEALAKYRELSDEALEGE